MTIASPPPPRKAEGSLQNKTHKALGRLGNEQVLNEVIRHVKPQNGLWALASTSRAVHDAVIAHHALRWFGLMTDGVKLLRQSNNDRAIGAETSVNLRPALTGVSRLRKFFSLFESNQIHHAAPSPWDGENFSDIQDPFDIVGLSLRQILNRQQPTNTQQAKNAIFALKQINDEIHAEWRNWEKRERATNKHFKIDDKGFKKTITYHFMINSDHVDLWGVAGNMCLSSVPPLDKFFPKLKSLGLAAQQMVNFENLHKIKHLEAMTIGNSMPSNAINLNSDDFCLPSTLTTLEISDSQLTPPYLKKLVEKLDNLNNLIIDNSGSLNIFPFLKNPHKLITFTNRHFYDLNDIAGLIHLTSLQELSLRPADYLPHSEQLSPLLPPLSALTALHIENMSAAFLSTHLAGLAHLHSLTLDLSELAEWPKPIFELRSLKELSVRSNYLDCAPPNSPILQQLTTLDIRDNIFSKFPEFIFDMKQLEILHLGNTCEPESGATNIIKIIPSQISQLTRLKKLSARNCLLMYLETDLATLPHLTEVDIKGNKVFDISNQFIAPNRLTHLNISKNDVSALPEGLLRSKTLIDFRCKGNRLPSILHAASTFSSLEILKAERCEIVSIPDQLFELTNLRELSLSRNKIKSIPDKIYHLKSLKILSLDKNELTSVPPSISNLHLQILHLRENHLSFTTRKFLKNLSIEFLSV